MDYSALIINIFFAIVPSVILCYVVYKMDVIEKEPMSMLLRLFFLGVLITVPAAFVETTIISATNYQVTDYFSAFVMSFFVIALVEEAYKFLILYLGTWKNRNFNHIYDAIVYAAFVSLGFATLENILYVYQNGAATALLRAFVSVPAHAFYAVASGYYLGLAKLNQSIGAHGKSVYLRILSFVVPVILHGIFDFLLFINNNIVMGIFFLFVGLLYVVSFFKIKKISATEITCNLQ